MTQRPRAEDIPLAEGEPEGRPSGGATHNSADFGDYSRTRPSARGRCARAEGVGLPEAKPSREAVARSRAELAKRLKGEPTPQTPRPAPEGSTTFIGL